MNKIQFFKYASFGLLLLNILVLSFFVLDKKPRRPRNKPPMNTMKERVERILNLDDDQLISFNRLADRHEDQIILINDKQHNLLLPFFKSVYDSSIEIDEEHTLTQFQNLDREKLELTYQHFQEIKNILNEDQMSEFQEVMDVLISKIIRKEKRIPQKSRD